MVKSFVKNATYTLCLTRPSGYTFCLNVTFSKQENDIYYFCDSETEYLVSLDTKLVEMITHDYEIEEDGYNIELTEVCYTDRALLTNIVKGWQF